jgi:hypothetical protein
MNLLQARMDQGEHSGLSLSLNSNNRGGTVYKVGQSDEFLSVLHIRMDPHHFRKLDPDPNPHQSGMLDPDPHPHQSEKP